MSARIFKDVAVHCLVSFQKLHYHVFLVGLGADNIPAVIYVVQLVLHLCVGKVKGRIYIQDEVAGLNGKNILHVPLMTIA